MKPSPLRANVWPKMQDAGRQIQAFAQSTRYITYIDVAPVMLRNRQTHAGTLRTRQAAYERAKGMGCGQSCSSLSREMRTIVDFDCGMRI